MGVYNCAPVMEPRMSVHFTISGLGLNMLNRTSQDVAQHPKNNKKPAMYVIHF